MSDELPAPRFSRKTPAGRRLNSPDTPGGQPDPSPAASVVVQPRWARCPVDRQLHLLAPVDVAVAAAQGHASASCGRRINRGGSDSERTAGDAVRELPGRRDRVVSSQLEGNQSDRRT